MLTTRCPACLTAFRITQAQVNARGGKVRCGRCTMIFDARDALSDLAEDAAQPSDTAHMPELATPAEIPIPPARAEHWSSAAEPVAKALPKEQPATSLAWSPKDAKTGSMVAPAFRKVPARTRPTEWWITLALLLIVLAGQIAFRYRGEIALLLPEFKPQMQVMCEMLGCELPLPRRAELMSIELSDLQADTVNPAVMVLSAALRNRAAFPQAYPALELTLTDTQDQPLARRVLLARDYLDRATNTKAGFPANSELPVKVFIEAASLGAAGYRLYLFYP